MTMKTKQKQIEALEENLRITAKNRDESRDKNYDLRNEIKSLKDDKINLESDSQRNKDYSKKLSITLERIMEILAITDVSAKSKIEVLEGIFKEEIEYKRNSPRNNRYNPGY